MTPPRIEPRSPGPLDVINFFVVMKFKPHEIYERTYNGYGERCFNQTTISKWGKHSFANSRLSREDNQCNGNTWTLFWKNIFGTAVSKEGPADSSLNTKRTHLILKGHITIELSEKVETVNNAFY